MLGMLETSMQFQFMHKLVENMFQHAKRIGWPVRSSLSHAIPVRTEVFIGVGNSEGAI